MEKFNRIYKELLETNKLKNTVLLEPKTIERLHGFSIENVNIQRGANKPNSIIQIEFNIEQPPIVNLKLEEHHLKEFSSPVLIRKEDGAIQFEVEISKYFSKTKDFILPSSESKALHDFFKQLFENIKYEIDICKLESVKLYQ